MLRFMTSGETHGKCLTAIIEGMPAGLGIDIVRVNEALARRQAGYGRGGRMSIEHDRAEILSGVRGGVTLGSPIAVKIENRDWENWENTMGTEQSDGTRRVTCPRPGHADLAGGMKYGHTDLRNVLERASARETAARVAVGAIAGQLCESFGIRFFSHVASIGTVRDRADITDETALKNALASPVGFADREAERAAMEYIDKIKADGESCGGVVETVVTGLVPGLGSYVHYDRKIDARIAMSVMSIQAIKGVEFGLGFGCAGRPGSGVHDEIFYSGAYERKTNNAGGVEGGMTNGEPLIVRAAMKPIPTLYNPLKTFDISKRTEVSAAVERSDICAVPACSVVVEAAVRFEIAAAFSEKFGGDCIEDIRSSFDAYKERIRKY